MILFPALLCANDLTLDLTCVIPPPDVAMEKLSIRAHVYVYDPRMADRPAQEIDQMEILDLNLRTTEPTTVTFPTRRISSEPGSYYITVFVHPDAQSGERLYFINGFQKVFENGPVEKLKVTLTPVNRREAP